MNVLSSQKCQKCPSEITVENSSSILTFLTEALHEKLLYAFITFELGLKAEALEKSEIDTVAE